MKRNRSFALVVILLVLGLAAGSPMLPGAFAQAGTLVAKKAAAPTLDGTVDPAWNQAPALAFKAVGGKNLPGGSTDVTLRAVYTADSVYFLLQ